MNSLKKKSLEKAYSLFFKAGTQNVSGRPLREFVDGKVIGIGTAIDEKLRGIGDFRKLLQIQKKQMKGMGIRWEKKPFSRQITTDENTAVYADDVYLTVGTGQEKVKMYFRFSIILHYNGNSWKVIHWHGSKPEEVKSEQDTFGIEQWKQKTAALQKLVDQRTADLLIKNRELEIEAALEKVRSVAMGMKERADMLKICSMIARQLAVLGLQEIRNVQTAIFNVPKGTYMNYEFYARHEKTFITETLYTNHQVALAFARKMLKGKGAVSITHIKGKEKVMDWLRYQKSTNVFIDSFLKTASSLSYYWYSLGPVALGISTYQPLGRDEMQLFERFLKVFELAYQRYLDIEKAEAQAKEAQIEAALERVRARSMAMQDSSEIGNLIMHVYREMNRLDARLDRCFFMITEPETLGITWWMASKEGLLAENGFFVQNNQHPTHLLYLDHWKKRSKKWYYLFEGKEKRDWDRFGFSQTELARLPEPVKRFMAGAKRVYLYGSSDTFGSLVTGSFETLPEEHQDIISRFALVFNQTYTRFTDLKIAEAQSREAQIQLALERVRARTMAMQHSSELPEMVAVLFEQFRLLGEEPERMAIEIVNEEEHVFDIWATQHGGSQLNQPVKISLDEPHVMQKMYRAWKSKKKSISIDLKGKSLEEYYQYLKKMGLPVQRKIFGKRRVQNVATFSRGILTIITPEPRPAETIRLLERFAAVFDGTYTRFLDLQKAEAQAREAEIELALERVRARALAMHSSDEFMEVARVLREQMGLMGQKELETSAVHLYEEEPDFIYSWRAFRISSEVKGKISYGFFKIPRNSCAVAREFEQHFNSKAGEYTIEISGDRQKEWYKILFKLAPEVKEAMIKNKVTREKRYYHFSRFSGGALLMVSSSAPGVEVKELQKRSAQVFDLAYRRFKDLQKAEAQAREAEIELALERIRARTMAMQQSTELPEAANLLFQQMQALGMPAWSAGYCIWKDHQKAVTLWMSSEGVLQPPFEAPTTEDELFIQMRRGHEPGKPLHVVEMGGQELEAHYAYMRTLPVVGEIFDSILEAGHPLPTYQVMHYAYFSKGFLLFITYEPVPQSHDIFIRFANVFDQTYTRFLDLQKAEAQAREAQIEVAVERVRAKALAMHRSEDLHSVVVALKNELEGLNIPDIMAATIYLDQGDGYIRILDLSDAALPKGKQPHLQLDKVFRLADTDPGLWINRMWNRQEHYFVLEADAEDFERTIAWIRVIDPSSGELAEKMIREKGFQKAWLPTVKLNNGVMNIDLLAPPAAEIENIMLKIGAGFDLAYKRFLDLQKAEAQAREAQIETALERVRSRTMAMHQSAELLESSEVLFSELQKLGIESLTAGFVLIDQEEKNGLNYTPDPYTKKILPEPVIIPHDETKEMREVLDHWKKGALLFVVEMDEEETILHQTFIANRSTHFTLTAAELIAISPSRLFLHNFYFKEGYLLIVGGHLLSEEQKSIMLRFAKIFQQTYTRFLDLQKAEAQAREAQIQLALERVRARTMAMHHSDELKETTHILFEQMKELGEPVEQLTIGIVNEANNVIEISATVQGDTLKKIYNHSIEEPYMMAKMYKAWKQQQKTLVVALSGDELNAYNRYRNALTNSTMFPTSLGKEQQRFVYAAFFSKGMLALGAHETRPPELLHLLAKFASVFDLTYTRFIDLQKAEAQAREAHIEMALERVRSRSMAMHKSEELAALSLELVKQVQGLGVSTWFCAFNIYDDDPQGSLEWGSNGQGVFPKYRTPREGIFLRYYQAGQSGETLLVNEIGEEECPAHYEYLCSLPGVGDQLRQMKAAGIPFPASQIDHVAFFKHGYIIFITYEPVPETHDIFKRFARVFEQSYTRFLDLQKAEGQARDAQIEVAVERVRAKALAMHRSQDILQVAITLKKQLEGLELKGVTAATIYLQQDNGLLRVWDITELKDAENGPQLTTDFAFALEDTDPGLWIRRIWEAKEKYSVIEMSEDDFSICERWLRSFDPVAADNYLRFIETADLQHSWHPTVPLENGKLNIDFILPPPAEMEFILPKMGAAFDLAYRRFQDLQKAEAQAREAQIEAALERVRSRSIGMQRSDELREVIRVVYDQLVQLQIKVDHAGFVVDYRPKSDWHFWIADPQEIPARISHPYFESVWATQFEEAREKGLDFFATLLDFEEKNRFYQDLLQHVPDLPKQSRDFYFNCPGLAASTVLMENVGLYIENFSAIPYSEEENRILIRFGKAFQQTYTRFLDLQRAEAQTREAQIESALERVRSRSLAMHHSSELSMVVDVLLREFTGLKFTLTFCIINLINEEDRSNTVWAANPETGMEPESYYMKFEDYPFHQAMWKAWKEQQKSFIYILEGEEKKIYDAYLYTDTEFRRFPQHVQEANKALPRYVAGFTFFKHSGLQTVSENPISPDDLAILERFGRVFEQSYTRFLDLQKAEAQAREAQIEAALEKVRSRTMAMQSSNELQETAALLFQEFRKLGAEDMYQVTIGIYDEASQLIDFRVTSWAGSGEQENRSFQLDMREPTVLQPAVQAWKNHQKSMVVDLSGDALEGWLQYRNKMSGISVSSADTGGRRVISAAFYSKGHLSISTREPVSADTLRTLERFAAVFDSTYTRFQDLQKAEAQAKEARIEAALERVRSRTLAMQKSDELAETAAVLFQQLITLGIEPNRLYIILIKENNEEMEAWVTDEDGSKVSMGFTGNYNRNGSLYKMYEGWKEKRTSLVIDMQGEELQQYFHYLHDELQVPFKGGLEQKRRVQHITYFSHGLIGMASPEEQPIETLQLMERFAAVFNLTFTRFNDLKIAEAHAAQAELDLIAIKEAKQKAEEALTELQATQKQLIQSEKMASLGELTAGIAHEIQNPLNFVNNFSEVSRELLAELNDELEKGNLDDVREIMRDVIQNLEKIHHHGKRADGIVKGMLQHSRTGSGQMEATDINALCDEYLRLSFHGLRAKDKSFNARFETEFDPSVGKVNVLPQELGRVILNLINNAFYAVAERKKSDGAAYEPSVLVRTKRMADSGAGVLGAVSISVKDNGAGIPKNILDKIFQPFFTTKPTGQGTGLGLSLSYDIVKAHGGELQVETKEGEGTTFQIILP